MKEVKKIIFPIILIIIVLIILYIFVKPYYKIEDRTKNINNFKKMDGGIPVGWIRVQGTNIDFPIVYHDDVDISDASYELGWTFSSEGKLEKKMTIFSHNVLNVSSRPLINNKNHKRFEPLMAYIYTDFVKKNKYIEYTVGNKNYLYKIYGVSFQKEKELDYINTNPNKSEINKYIEKTTNSSYFNFNIDVNSSDKLITLVTCTRFFGETTEYSFVVDARMVRKGERISNYKVTENANYKKIKSKLKGDVDDEEI